VDWKRIGERRHFEWFCQAAELPLIPGCIEQPEPPAPDIIAEFAGLGRIAFELVRLNDPDHLTRLRLLHQMPGFLDGQLAALQVERRQALTAKFRDAYITIDFQGAASLAQRRQAMPFVWDMLDAVPDDFRGAVDLYGKNPPAELSMIWVSRIKTDGRPYFRSQSIGYVLPLRPEEITGKLRKSYATDHPLELLAYVENGEMAHLNAEREIREVVNRWLPGSQFRRVWVFEGLLRNVSLSLP
jgi:hypothetical protein